MRGTRRIVRSRIGRAGIIPAYAGNTDNPTVQSASGRDHPRVCGEHVNAHTTQLNIQGSSPRMRGTLFGGQDYHHENADLE